MKFSGLALSEKMVNALAKMGYVEPSPIQNSVIPLALRGKNILAQSETGSGKTHAYLIPIIESLDKNLFRPQALIVSPTRELARQIYDFTRQFQRFYQRLTVRLYTPETEISENESGAKTNPPQIIIGTPGRLCDLLIKRTIFNVKSVKTVVLDEADMLLELGYFNDIETLFSALSPRQTMVFSATLKPTLKEELHKIVAGGFEYESHNEETPDSIHHHLVDIKHVGDSQALIQFLKIRRPYLCIVFASTLEKVKSIHQALTDNNIDSLYFSGALDDRSRRKALRDIRENRYSIIVASDILARGIDIPDVSDVISVDLPHDLDFYFHRSGRTGRFGKSGDSWVFYNADSETLPRQLMADGVPFDFYVLKNDTLEPDPVGLAPKTKLFRKKELPQQELKDIKIAKAKARAKHIEPMYKKKRQFAIEKVKKKYRRKAIQRSIRSEIAKKGRIQEQLKDSTVRKK